MRQLTAFTKKEFLESLRTGRMPLLVILSVLFGIMNPLTAKLLPWMLKTFTGSLEESGMVLTEIKVDVFTSWTQFYKNIPLFLIIFYCHHQWDLNYRISEGHSDQYSHQRHA